MQIEYAYPAIADRFSPKEQEELGKPNLLEATRQRKEDIPANSHPSHVSDTLDAELLADLEFCYKWHGYTQLRTGVP